MSTTPQVVRGVAEVRQAVGQWRKNGLRVALVPTMGALHAGHLALVHHAAEVADRTLVSIFVNPTQFAPTEDLARYPRDEAGDLAILAGERCDLVWAPTVQEMYPQGFATRLIPGGAAQGLESDFRPHFFAGVATVCAKLFGATTSDVAVFGEKDYQQLCVIRQLVRDLDMPVAIAGVPTVREADGLALSSRNVYLSAAERGIAPSLHRVLTAVAKKAHGIVHGDGAAATNKTPRARPLVRDPTLPPEANQLPDLETICDVATLELEATGFTKVDYVAVRHAGTLRPVTERGSGPLRVLAAAWLGKTRLIDNVPA